MQKTPKRIPTNEILDRLRGTEWKRCAIGKQMMKVVVSRNEQLDRKELSESNQKIKEAVLDVI